MLLITKNSETLIEHTHKKAEETLKFKLSKPRGTFHFNTTILIERSWLIGFTSLGVYNSALTY